MTRRRGRPWWDRDGGRRDEEPSEGVTVSDGDVRVIRETDLAVLLRGRVQQRYAERDPFGTEETAMSEFWVPRSQLHSSCSARHVGDVGPLVVSEWWAQKMADGDTDKRSSEARDREKASEIGWWDPKDDDPF